MTILDFLAPQPWLNERQGPRYAQLRKRLAEGVDSGLLAVGDTLPPEREIASITGLSRVTVRKAIQALVEDGLIIQRQGSGSFVAPHVPKLEQSLSLLTSFSEDMARRGMASTSVWLDRGVFIPSPDEVFALGLAQDAAVSRIARLRMADGKPMAIERASLPTQILPNPQLVEGSLYAALDQIGLRPVRALQKISAVNLDEKNADLLAVTAGMAGLQIERTSFLADGRTVEFTQSIYRGDAYNFVAELRLMKE